MPDPRPARRFEREMMALERGYTAGARQALAETGRLLLEALMRLGLNDASLPALFRREMEAMARRVSALGRSQAGAVQEAAMIMARSQFEALGRVRLAVPPFEAVQAVTERERAELARLLDSAAWVEALETRLQAEVIQLRAGGEPVEAAARQLFSTGPAGTGRASVWRLGANNMELVSQRTIGSVALGLAAIYYQAGQAQTGRKWHKQAVAQIDDKTTDCCLNVHGQVQPIDEPFILTGTPRFADEQMHPRFHWQCRTDEILWAEDLEAVGQSTAEMRAEVREQRFFED